MYTPQTFLILLVFGFLLSCGKAPSESEDKDYIIRTFKPEDVSIPDSLIGKKLNITSLLNPKSILWTGKYLVVGERKVLDYHLHVVDPDSVRLINTTGKDGFGPGEIVAAYQLQRGKSVNECWVYNHTQKLMALFDLNSPGKLYQKAFRQPENMFLAVDMLWNSDSTLICQLADGDDQFVIYDTLGNQLSAYGKWSQMLEDRSPPPNVVSAVHQGKTSISPDHRKYVQVGLLRDYIEILDLPSGKITSVNGPEHNIPEFEVDYSAGYPMAQFTDMGRSHFYKDVVAGEKYIYALYFGKSMDAYFQEGETAREIYVFDYDGNLVETYTLDYSLISLAVDEKNKRFFGISSDEDPNVVIFEYTD
ncbi:TolB-like 6-blade propeller-like [Cyclobacterium lianum]|uniref:TolB-like 6-blade propeller-like n=1 Tax=Cyclobacterium lianum TaxID=388280 RepID=A0A1M7QED4_9BACT|nr:BF3164 family lipoprotein [Cyclobacterium lianum]SHN29265.1 TolB-like 6-blade propeller-like [Cyclobacterium lianum]